MCMNRERLRRTSVIANLLWRTEAICARLAVAEDSKVEASICAEGNIDDDGGGEAGEEEENKGDEEGDRERGCWAEHGRLICPALAGSSLALESDIPSFYCSEVQTLSNVKPTARISLMSANCG